MRAEVGPPPSTAVSTGGSVQTCNASMLSYWTRYGSRRYGSETVGGAGIAVGETVILPHPPLPAVGVSIGMERGRQQNNSLADG